MADEDDLLWERDMDGESLVKRGPHNHPDSNSKSIGNGYYVNTHMNTKNTSNNSKNNAGNNNNN